MKHLLALVLFICLVSCQEDVIPKAIVLNQKSLTYLKAGKLEQAIIYSDSTLSLIGNMESVERHDFIEIAQVYGAYVAHVCEYINNYKSYTPFQIAVLEENITYLEKHENDADDIYSRGLVDRAYVNNTRAIIANTAGMKKARKEYKEFKLHGKY